MGLSPVVLGSGSPNSDLVIVGEAPGYREIDSKMAFTGSSGRVLWEALRKHGITRTQCYVTNVVKRQVAGDTDDERVAVGKDELSMWQHLLRFELEQLPNARYVLLLGNYALEACLGYSGITHWRGSVIQLDKRAYVISFNPAMTLREPKWEIIFRFDIGKLVSCMKGTFKEHQINAVINPSYNEALSYLDRLQDQTSPVAFDIEVISNETACIGFADGSHTGICINFRTQKDQTYSLREERNLLRRTQQFFSSSRTRLVAQNGVFDSSWLWYKDRIKVPGVWFDTMLAHHTLYPQLPHNLGFLTSQYTTHPYYKDDGKTWREAGDINQFWEYNVKDCCVTWAAHQRMHDELRTAKLEKFFFDHVMKLQPHLVRATVCGVKLDMSMKEGVRAAVAEEVATRRREFVEAARRATGQSDLEVNPASHRQMGDLLFNKLKLVGRGTKVDEANRKRMLIHPRTSAPAKEVLIALDRFAEEDKFRSTYAEMQIDEDGRVRSEYKQSGTTRAPGRLSSAGLLWVVKDESTGEWRRSGANLQNQPVRAQPMFVADKGYTLSYFDLSQAEARVVAYKWQVRGLIDNFELQAKEGIDVHRANASRIFRVPLADIPSKDWTDEGKPTRRYLGKRCVHGLNYRMGADKLAEVCNIPYNQAFEAWRSYHRAFPEIQQGWEQTIQRFQKERVMYNAFGRRLIILGRMDDAQAESIIAFYPQSTIGDKVTRTWWQCERDPEWPKDARMILNIHDAMIAMHRPWDAVKVRRIMKKYAEEPIWVEGTPIVIPAELKASKADSDGIHRWGAITGPDGVKSGGLVGVAA